MRRSIPLALVLAALCGCAAVSTTAPKKHQQKSYWERVGNGVIDPRATSGPSTVIWVHPPEQPQLGRNPW